MQRVEPFVKTGKRICSIMKPITRFSLKKHEGPYEDWGGKSQILIDGVLTNHWTPGYILLHQFKIGDGFLLLLNYDCPFEESVVAVRLSEDFKILAEKHFGFWYCSWDLDDISVQNPWTLDISFGPEDWYRLSLQKGKHKIKSRKLRKRSV